MIATPTLTLSALTPSPRSLSLPLLAPIVSAATTATATQTVQRDADVRKRLMLPERDMFPPGIHGLRGRAYDETGGLSRHPDVPVGSGRGARFHSASSG